MSKSILIVASHPDDEVLGCGGTIARHVEEGDKVNLIFMTNGVGSRLNSNNLSIKKRERSTKKAQSILGISSFCNLGFPDNSMDKIPLLRIVKKIEKNINKFKPDIIYTHHNGDLNIDHRLTHSAVMTACRPIPYSTIKAIYGFEILSSTEWSNSRSSLFNPTYFVNISKQIKKKLKALDAYAFEMRNKPHSRSIRHAEILSEHRGYSVGINNAEAFEIYRIIK